MTSPTPFPAHASAEDAPAAQFEALRPRLFAVAYRMLGARADAEDLVQEAWLRWHRTDTGEVLNPEAWLVTTITRLAIDRLRAAKAEREAYVGWWLPEPLVELDTRTPETAAELAGELSLAFLWVLERLGPEERAAFLLRQVFDYDYPDIATRLDKTEAHCRQLVHRASQRVREARQRFDVPRDVHHALLQRFVIAARKGDRQAIEALLAQDAQLIGDGGGKVTSFPHPLCGARRIGMLYWALWRRHGQGVEYRFARLNGEPGVLRYVHGQLESAQAFTTNGEHITGIYVVRNPDKLQHMGVPQHLPADNAAVTNNTPSSS